MDVVFSSGSSSEISADLLALGVGPSWQEELEDLDARFGGHLRPWVKAKSFTGKAGAAITLPTLGHIEASKLCLVGVGERSPAELKRAAGHAGREARDAEAQSLALALGDADSELAERLIEAVAAGNYEYDKYKPKKDRAVAIQTLTLMGTATANAAAATMRASHQSFARDLVNAPAADIYPESLAAAAQALTRLDGVDVEVWDIARCEAEKCVGIVAVGRGSSRPGCLIHVRYRPSSARRHIALVGKGVTYDSGGLSLKGSANQQTMRCDMGGAATVLGAVGAIAEMGLDVAVDCFVGSVENMTGADAYKLGDILQYPNGVNVEIHNTDAEGRLVLADCLIRASQVEGVTHIVDAATLTGACVVALGPDFTGMFTDNDELATALSAAADSAGEGIWRMPLHEPYKKMLKADWGQIKNVGKRDAGATTAALFLQHFVSGGAAWAHLDIAGAAFMDGNHGHYRSGATGQMVRTLVRWVEAL